MTRFSAGDGVYGTTSRGSFAEYTVARGDRLARRPAGVSVEGAAVVPVSGTTTLQGLTAGRTPPTSSASPTDRVRRRAPGARRTFPLDRVPDAMRYLDAGRVRGKVAITVRAAA